MKKTIVLSMLVFSLAAIPVMAQPPGGGGGGSNPGGGGAPAGVPIDGGLSLLIGAGAALGGGLWYKKRKDDLQDGEAPK